MASIEIMSVALFALSIFVSGACIANSLSADYLRGDVSGFFARELVLGGLFAVHVMASGFGFVMGWYLLVATTSIVVLSIAFSNISGLGFLMMVPELLLLPLILVVQVLGRALKALSCVAKVLYRGPRDLIAIQRTRSAQLSYISSAAREGSQR